MPMRLTDLRGFPCGLGEYVDALIQLVESVITLQRQGFIVGVVSEKNIVFSRNSLALRSIKERVCERNRLPSQRSFDVTIYSVYKTFLLTCDKWSKETDWTFLAWKVYDRVQATYKHFHDQLFLSALFAVNEGVYRKILKVTRTSIRNLA